MRGELKCRSNAMLAFETTDRVRLDAS